MGMRANYRYLSDRNLKELKSYYGREDIVWLVGGVINMLLDSERYEAVIAYGKEAINQLDDNKIEAGFSIAEQG